MIEELAAEDQLRLNVLLTQDVKAIRLDESRMELRALTGNGEASMPLHPTCRSDRYLRLVREALSGHALGSPGGYPVYLSRWTRHGQMESADLGKLLLSGEPEAVVAVVYSPALTDELAEYAWWAMPTIENARLMLCRDVVARGHMGKILAAFLAEHLPFLQDDHLGIMDTVAVLIHSGCLDEAALHAVWLRGRRSNTYYVPFLECAWPGMAAGRSPRPDHDALQAMLAGMKPGQGGRVEKLAQVTSGLGQAFIDAALEVLARPETQEVVSRTLNAIGGFFGFEEGVDGQQVMMDRLAEDFSALLALKDVGEDSVTPIFARTTAIGSLMRNKIEPVTSPVRAGLKQLQRPKVSPA